MKNKYKITMMDMLQMAKKASRETNHVVKPIKTEDKKKKENKLACRKNIEYIY
jgi:hypothetical protein